MLVQLGMYSEVDEGLLSLLPDRGYCKAGDVI